MGLTIGFLGFFVICGLIGLYQVASPAEKIVIGRVGCLVFLVGWTSMAGYFFFFEEAWLGILWMAPIFLFVLGIICAVIIDKIEKKWKAEQEKQQTDLQKLEGKESHVSSPILPTAPAVSIPHAGLAATAPVSSDIAAPSKPLWYYFDKNGNKIAVTVGQIKELARQGTIVPETILENPEGKTAPARTAKGLVFAGQ